MLQLNVNLLFTIINLVVLYLLLKKFLIKPITGIMEKREKMIADGMQNAATAQADAEKMRVEYETAISGAKTESTQMIEKARKEAKAEYERIVGDAGEKAQGIVTSAKENIQIEREQTMKALQSEIAGLAMNAAEKIVGEKTGNQDLYNQFLKEAGGAHEDTENK